MSNLSDKQRALLFSAEVGEDVLEIDLHGLSEPEALRELDLFLNRAFALREPYVRIVHGSGTGRLREVIQEHLSKHDFIEVSVSASPPLGSGVTVGVMRVVGKV